MADTARRHDPFGRARPLLPWRKANMLIMLISGPGL